MHCLTFLDRLFRRKHKTCPTSTAADSTTHGKTKKRRATTAVTPTAAAVEQVRSLETAVEGTGSAATRTDSASQSTIASTQPPELVVPASKSGESEPSGAVQGSGCGGLEEEPALATASLWDRAVVQLAASDAKLVADYEELLLKHLIGTEDATTTDAAATDTIAKNAADRPMLDRNQLDRMLDLGLDRKEKNKLEYMVFGKKFVIEDKLSEATDLVLKFKNFVSEAVKVSPEASLAWAGVCVILPLFTNPSTAYEAQSSGFHYVTSRVQLYAEYENRVRKRRSVVRDEMTIQLQVLLVDLYKELLRFQLRTVVYFYRSWIKNTVKGSLFSDEWESMVNQVKDAEGIVAEYLSRLRETDMIATLQEMKNRRLAASYFFSRARQGAGEVLKFLPTIASQLAQSLPVYKSILRDALSDMSGETLAKKSLEAQFDILFRGLLEQEHIGSVNEQWQLVVVDALDECKQQTSLRELVGLLAELASLELLRLRVFITSRDDTNLSAAFLQLHESKYKSLDLHKDFSDESTEDIRSYLTNVFEKTNLAMKTKDPKGLLRDQDLATIIDLSTKPFPLFIYASTFHRFLQISSPRRTPRSQLDRWLQNPDRLLPQLTQLYLQVLREAFKPSSDEQDYFTDAETLELEMMNDGSNMQVWDTKKAICLRTIRIHAKAQNHGLYSPDQMRRRTLISGNGKVLLIGTSNHEIQVRSITTGACIRVFEDEEKRISPVALSPDGQRFALDTENLQHFHVYGLDSNVPMRVKKETKCTFSDKVSSYQALFSPESAIFAYVVGNEVYLTDMDTTERSSWCLSLDKPVTRVEFSADSQFLAACLQFGEIVIWDISDSVCNLISNVQWETQMPIAEVAFSENGLHVGAMGFNRDFAIWDIATGAAVELAGVRRLQQRTDVRWVNQRFSFHVGESSHVATLWGVREFAPDDEQLMYAGYGLSDHFMWIMKGSEKVIYLPPEYRCRYDPYVMNSVIVLRHDTRKMLLLKLT
ncbi:ankyrin repeat protein [Beauveria brongniartii RCEF 3172]|uniref:Ankyrin repeat protein n=1 Tax=Beauveria brongniartii RCEF 3172 TaxID=1081107 RepID=A0A162JN71_9HYPO|nr:ankyrin repeat protein [Beauveria brongniartii RCEF 3172]